MNEQTLSSGAAIAGMAAWTYFAFACCCLYSARRAICLAFLVGTLFLPVVTIKMMPGLPVFTRATFLHGILFLLTVLFYSKAILRFRPHWADLPMLLWCTCPLLSSLSNDLGWYDGCGAIMFRTCQWGLAYLLGRIFFSNLSSGRRLALAIFHGGLIYVPFCLFEIKMSPQLHRMVYGYFQHSFAQTIRYDGFRPMVFMNHGLMVGFWMMAASLIGFWLWTAGAFRGEARTRAGWGVALLLLTTVWLKSTGAVIYLVLGCLSLLVVRRVKKSGIIFMLACLPLLYPTLRATSLWSGAAMVDFISQRLGAERAQSIAFRLYNEELIIDRTSERLLFGWAGWNRAGTLVDVTGETSGTTVIFDGLWLIAFSSNGIWGLCWVMISLLLPAYLIGRYCPVRDWLSYSVAPTVAMMHCAVFIALDGLFNDMPNPFLLLMLGAVTGQALALKPRAERRRLERETGNEITDQRWASQGRVIQKFGSMK